MLTDLAEALWKFWLSITKATQILSLHKTSNLKCENLSIQSGKSHLNYLSQIKFVLAVGKMADGQSYPWYDCVGIPGYIILNSLRPGDDLILFPNWHLKSYLGSLGCNELSVLTLLKNIQFVTCDHCSGSLELESSCHDRDWIMEIPMEADILTFTGILTPEDASVASCFPFDITISLSWFPLLSIPPLHSAIP